MSESKYIFIFLLIAITVLINLNSFQNDFTNWDDEELIVNNTKIKKLSLKNIDDIFTSSTGADYLPLKEISFVIQCPIWRLRSFEFPRATDLPRPGHLILVFLII